MQIKGSKPLRGGSNPPSSAKIKNMKKVLLVLLVIAAISCSKKSVYSVTFEEHFPSRIDTVVVTDKFKCVPKVQSYQGTNYIGLAYESTAPLVIIKTKKVE